ncbi:MAG TPA: hypothetical protein VL283_01675 [Candidatus Baltobacteraceae bacterium]|jgi:hypothetical protein|nr:hypothetical protein [Candidatus Baltobacteraceae bacterium]
MLVETKNPPPANGLDTFIKVLTIVKLFLQLAFYGILLGGTLWFLLANPLPKLMEDFQAQALKSFMDQQGR